MKPPRSLPVAAPRGGFDYGPAKPDPCQTSIVGFMRRGYRFGGVEN